MTVTVVTVTVMTDRVFQFPSPGRVFICPLYVLGQRQRGGMGKSKGPTAKFANAAPAAPDYTPPFDVSRVDLVHVSNQNTLSVFLSGES